MKRKNADGSYDTYHPMTKAENVTLTDPATGKKYVWAIQNGQLGIREV